MPRSDAAAIPTPTPSPALSGKACVTSKEESLPGFPFNYSTAPVLPRLDCQ